MPQKICKLQKIRCHIIVYYCKPENKQQQKKSKVCTNHNKTIFTIDLNALYCKVKKTF